MKKDFTIGVDIRVLAGRRQSGVEQYVQNLLPALIRSAPQIKFKLFYNSREGIPLDYPWLKESNAEFFSFDFSSRLLALRSRLFNRPWVDELLDGVDVFFSPHLLLAPLTAGCPRVLTFHDLSFLRYPQFFSYAQRFWHEWVMAARRQAERASKIIAVSYSTRNDLVSLWGIDPGKIKVIYSGISLKKPAPADPTEINRVCSRYQLPQKFFLYFGTVEPRKNILSLLRAFDWLHTQKRIPSDAHLVIAGEKGWQNEELQRFYRKSLAQRLIHFLGVVDERDKALIYSLAKVFVYPSFFEGFGFPPLEAMVMGVPVITSRTSSLPEVVGDAAMLVDPYNLTDLSEAMQILLSSKSLREQYRAKGLKRAEYFSWERTAQATLQVLTSV